MALTIRNGQLGKLEAVREENFSARLAQFLQEQFPEYPSGSATDAVALARSSGRTSERDLAKFAVQALVMGAQPQPATASQRKAIAGGTRAAATVFSRHPPSSVVLPCPVKTWIEIRLVGMTGKPVPNERYAIHLSGGNIVEGTLDAEGCARVDGIDPGDCRVTFPELDRWAVEPIAL